VDRHRGGGRRPPRAPLAAALCAALLAFACGSGGPAVSRPAPSAPLRLGPVDLLVFAPHPDDEVIGTGGVLQQALAAGKRVRVVFVTNGDAYPDAASALFNEAIAALRPIDYLRMSAVRQREAIAADGALGVSPSSLVFLGYPDGALAGLYAGAGAPLRSPTTGLTATYGLVRADYHTLAHGRAAPYDGAAALADVEEILAVSRPAQVYLPDPADQHPDHWATYDLVHDAIAATGWGGAPLTFIAHSGVRFEWPWPHGSTPRSPFAAHVVAGAAYPLGVPWPPPVRVRVTPGQSAAKLRALAAHRSQWALPLSRLYMASFVKSEEVFWTAR
jgi:LmbE family N-acetylglucosaminyl deacetylase